MKFPVALYLVPGLVGLDLAAKIWALGALDVSDPAIALMPGLSLKLAFNSGVSFGFFSGSPFLVLIVTAVLVLALTIWFFRTSSSLDALALGCIIAGAVSNLADRGVHGAVTDFLAWGPRDSPFFVNNLADIWITAGVLILFGGPMLRSIGSRRPKTAK
ncbi:signal peptidase II [Pelagibacterium sp. 26DY04]|uniref:signal peptidase II n=1 Tax=Pelagibacterium sp. 26DY04 TaxID=2967130 RepID=UPI002815ACB8|nr:signal peptidase II [Pelagibacterium sp. 26DY04]WMT86455.1 signal peptidase II [Pelagibacterium sp. 26DY04]